MEDEGTTLVQCACCGHEGFVESDGFFYCQECGSQADDILLNGVADQFDDIILDGVADQFDDIILDGVADQADDIILNGVAD